MKISIRSYAIVLATALALLCATAQGASALTVHGSVQQVYVVGAHAHQRVALLDRRGHVVQSRRAGSLGGIVYRGVKPGPGYRVRPAGGSAHGPSHGDARPLGAREARASTPSGSPPRATAI